MRETIFAPATAAGRAAVAVVRMSGPRSATITAALCGAVPEPRRASLRRLQAHGEVLDEALVIWMPGPGSFTGEDSAEFHLHGGFAVIEAVAAALVAAGARLAAPGEFTRRAFEAGRLDLTQAEAVADLIDAETEAQRKQATAQLSGALSNRYHAWQATLLDALAFIEAGIDFPEDDVPDGVVSRAAPLIDEVADTMRRELGNAGGQRVRDGYRIALIGAPNVGKSSILNALVGRDAAIVTPVAGTTRDVVEAHLVLEGQAIRIADTAGLREAQDVIEAEGVRRAQAWAEEADLRIVVADASRPETVDFARQQLRAGDVLTVNKIDLCAESERWVGAVHISAAQGAIEPLQDAVRSHMRAATEVRAFPAITRQRHRALLAGCVEHLERATTSRGAELTGEDIRLALRAIGQVTGQASPDAVLDRVFSTFCIGK